MTVWVAAAITRRSPVPEISDEDMKEARKKVEKFDHFMLRTVPGNLIYFVIMVAAFVLSFLYFSD